MPLAQETRVWSVELSDAVRGRGRRTASCNGVSRSRMMSAAAAALAKIARYRDPVGQAHSRASGGCSRGSTAPCRQAHAPRARPRARRAASEIGISGAERAGAEDGNGCSRLGPPLARSKHGRRGLVQRPARPGAEATCHRGGRPGTVRSRPRRSSPRCRCTVSAAARRTPRRPPQKQSLMRNESHMFAATPPATAKTGAPGVKRQIFAPARGAISRPRRRRRRTGTTRRDRRGRIV